MAAAWPQGLPTSPQYPDVGIGAVPAGSARRFSDREAFVSGEQALT
ncbi:hypothetical protein [Streptomyces sp. NPDC005435]